MTKLNLMQGYQLLVTDEGGNSWGDLGARPDF